MNVGKQLEAAPKNLVLYVIGLIGAVVDDYTLVTLAIFSVLLGFASGAWLIGLTTFFGGYFLLRLVGNLADVVAFHARTVSRATVASQPPKLGQVVDGDLIP